MEGSFGGVAAFCRNPMKTGATKDRFVSVVRSAGWAVLGSLVASLLGSPALASSNGRLDRWNLLEFRNDQGVVGPVRSVADWKIRRAEILAGMQAVMGPLPDSNRRVPLDLRIEEEEDGGEFVRYLVTYASEPDSRVPAYLIVPKAALAGETKASGVLCLMGTNRVIGHKVVAGLGGPESPPNRNHAEELARRGYVTIAPAYPLMANYHPDLKALGYVSGTMKAIWDNVRAVDLLASLPYVKEGGFGVIGHSLGGHNAIYTAAFDERLKVIVSSCGFDSYLDYMGGDLARWQSGRGWAQELYMPRILDYAREEIPFDFSEVVGALAPRAFFVNAPVGDSNFSWQSVARIFAAAMPVYRLYGAPFLIRVLHPDAGHDFPPEVREEAYLWLDTHL
jgi:pimeloyl-ACP methyl ester carboxylesterase